MVVNERRWSREGSVRLIVSVSEKWGVGFEWGEVFKLDN